MNLRLPSFASLTIAGLMFFTAPVHAHYLWVTINEKSAEQGTVEIFFEEGPHAGPGEYLDHFLENSKTWIRSTNELEPKEIKTEDIKENGKRWFAARLEQAAPRSVECYGKFGVYQYGKTNVLLHYYARCLDVAEHEDLHDFARAEHLLLEIVPHDSAEKMQLQVLWKGAAAENVTVKIRGPKKFQQNMQTDKSGTVTFEPLAEGRYTFHTMVELKEAGTDAGEAYELIRHHSTLSMQLPLKK